MSRISCALTSRLRTSTSRLRIHGLVLRAGLAPMLGGGASLRVVSSGGEHQALLRGRGTCVQGQEHGRSQPQHVGGGPGAGERRRVIVSNFRGNRLRRRRDRFTAEA